MTAFFRGLALAAAAGVALPVCGFAAPVTVGDYYGLRSVIQFGGGGIIDSKNENDRVTDVQQYNNAPTSLRSTISLPDGTLKAGVDVSGGDSATSFGFVNNQFGDTVTLSGGAETNVEFSLGVDGTIDVDAATEALNSFQAVSVTARLALFDAATGATLDNWFDMSFGGGVQTALDTDIFQYTLNNNTTSVFETIEELLSVSTVLASNSQSLQVFAQLDVVGIRNLNPGRTVLDFFNTAQLGIATADGVTYSSGSGVLLDGPPVVPLPAAGWLLLAGLAGLGLAGRRTRRA